MRRKLDPAILRDDDRWTAAVAGLPRNDKRKTNEKSFCVNTLFMVQLLKREYYKIKVKGTVFLAFTAFVGLVAFVNGAPAASRSDIARTTKAANVQRVTNANTTVRPGSTNAAARTSTTNARRAATTNATSRTSATGRAETVSRATVAPTVSRVATANSASRAITRASSGATSRRGATKSTLGRAVELHGVVDGDSNDTGVIAVVVDQSIIDAYENIRTYLSLRGKNNKKLFFKTVNTPNQHGSVNDLPSLTTLFSKIQAGNSITIDGIYNTSTAQSNHQYIDGTGASVVGKDSKFDSTET